MCEIRECIDYVLSAIGFVGMYYGMYLASLKAYYHYRYYLFVVKGERRVVDFLEFTIEERLKARVPLYVSLPIFCKRKEASRVMRIEDSKKREYFLNLVDRIHRYSIMSFCTWLISIILLLYTRCKVCRLIDKLIELI